MKAQSLKEVYEYALTFFGLPYIFGGDGSPRYFGGYDCSGLVQEILSSADMDPAGDQTADGLYRYFLEHGDLNRNGLGALAFFGTADRISHVGFCIDDKIMINAAGGGSHCKSTYSAKILNASVKIDPITHHNGLFAIIMPHYPF